MRSQKIVAPPALGLYVVCCIYNISRRTSPFVARLVVDCSGIVRVQGPISMDKSRVAAAHRGRKSVAAEASRRAQQFDPTEVAGPRHTKSATYFFLARASLCDGRCGGTRMRCAGTAGRHWTNGADGRCRSQDHPLAKSALGPRKTSRRLLIDTVSATRPMQLLTHPAQV